MKYHLLLLFLLCSCMLLGQVQLEQQALSNSGGFGKDRSISMSWTLGQTAIATLENQVADIVLTQGFQQPDLNNRIPIENFGVSIYPNPVEEALTLQLEAERFELPLQVQLIDGNGKVVKAFEVDSEKFTLSMADLSDGLYFISILLRQGRITHSVLKMRSK